MTAILTIVNNGLKSEGLPALSGALYGGTEDAALILQQKCNEANKELAREYEWPQLLKEGSITLVDGQAEYAFATDFDSWIFNTTYNGDQKWWLGPPMSPQEYQARKYSFLSTLIRQRYIVKGLTTGAAPTVTISPTPDSGDAGQVVRYMYLSTNRVVASVGPPATYAAEFSADTNHNLFDEDALRFRIMSHYFRSKGLGYEYLAAQALERSNERIAAIRGAGPVFAGRGRFGQTRFLNWQNIPDSGYGS